MIHNPILPPIRTSRKTRMPDPIRLLQRILIEHTPLIILPPVLHIHGVVSHQLKLTKAVVTIVRPRRGVNDEGLVCVGVCELLGAFVGGETGIEGAAVGSLFPWVGGDGEELARGEVGGYGVGI